MTADNFTYYLKNPEHLYQVSYQELKSLVVQYPYCQNLRYLLVTKSQIEASDDYELDLNLAATYSVDRSYLYQLVHKEQNIESSTESFVLNDDFLELKNISEPELAPVLETNELIKPSEGSENNEEDGIEPQPSLDQPENIIPHQRIIKRIKRVDLDNPSELDEPEVSESTLEIEPLEIDLESSEIPSEADQGEHASEDTGENISDQTDMITYMEKPKNRKSVIDQLLGRTPKIDPPIGKEIPPTPLAEEESTNLEDELESLQQPENNFLDLTPVKEEPTISREVLFEITNKTDKEMSALLNKNNEDEISSFDPTPETMENNLEEKNEVEVPKEPSEPAPKTAFKSYLDQFQPQGINEEIEKEIELENAIEEAVKEEEIPSIVKKKSPKTKKKKGDKKKKNKNKNKSEKGKREKPNNKKKKKNKIVEVANLSIQESEDVLSETLAELLAKQGSRKKAIQMYKRLSLIFPKKSSFFAKKIEKLKNKSKK